MLSNKLKYNTILVEQIRQTDLMLFKYKNIVNFNHILKIISYLAFIDLFYFLSFFITRNNDPMIPK